MILTKRQKFILLELINANKELTTKSLSSKFGVSQRAIGYDIKEIEFFVKNDGIKVIKTPGVGIILQKDNISLDYIENIKKSPVIISKEEREQIIISKFVASCKIISSEKIADELLLSKTSVVSSISDINKDLEPYNIKVRGKQNLGYELTGKEEDIRLFVLKILSPFIYKSIKENTLAISDFFNLEIYSQVTDVIKYIRNVLMPSISKDNEEMVSINIIYYIYRNQNLKFIEKNNYQNLGNIPLIKEVDIIYDIIVSKFKLNFCVEEKDYLLYMFLSLGLLDDVFELESLKVDENKLHGVVEEIIFVIKEYFFIIDDEIEVLRKDLFIHLKGTLKRSALNIYAENSILDEITSRFAYEFSVVKKAAVIFGKVYEVTLNEDEIGFITMYICKSIEISKSKTRKNVLIVCNTGRGASKLLETRIINNIPEINVVNTVSILNIDEDEMLLKNIDLVISTIPLKGLNKNVVVVSPIATTLEFMKIREYLHLESSYSTEHSSSDFNLPLAIENNIRPYVSEKNITKARNAVIDTFATSFNGLTVSGSNMKSDYANLISNIVIEAGYAFEEICKNEISEITIQKIVGIFIHIIMSVSRWQQKDFVIEKEIKYYRFNYPEYFKIIEAMLKKISNILGVKIKESEIIPILRYLLETQ